MTRKTHQDSLRTADLLDLFRRLSRPLEPVPTDEQSGPRILRGVRAVLFDVYGTLLISASGDIDAAGEVEPAGALQETLQSCRLSPQPDAGAVGSAAFKDEIRRRHAALRDDGRHYPEIDILSVWNAVVDQLVTGALISAKPSAQTVARLAIEYECRVNPVWPMPGAARALMSLRDRDLRLGIVSNAQFFTPLAIEALLGAAPASLGLEPALTAWSYQAGEAKPSPLPFLKPIERLAADGLQPDQIAFVGNDCLNDLLPAHELGLRPILFAGDRRSLRRREEDARCKRIRVAALITDLRHLPDLLARE
ncbi:MAG TPA: HAD family hydrolase [Verrucomicrobiae bacterium]|nr:HAD family hydrolase [Verrucomicrobiae bacterium]